MKRTAFALILVILTGMLAFGAVSAQGDFAIGDDVIVQGGPLELFTQPGGGTRLTEMPDGTVTKIVAGPEMVDGVAWWYITNNYGWVAGERDGQATLVPFDPAILEQTIAEASAAIAADANDADAYFRRGWAYFNQRDYDSAISDLTQAIILDPQNPALYQARGKVYLDASAYRNAIGDLTVALTYDPRDVSAYNRRGVAYSSLYSYAEAVQDYSVGLQIVPQYGLLYYNLGNIANDNNNIPLALDYFNQALSIDPNLHQVHYQRGHAYYNIGDYESAMAEFEQTLQYDPDEYYAYAGFGLVYEAQGDLETALDYFNQALDFAPDYGYLYRRRGSVYYRMARLNEAKADFDRAVELSADPGNEHSLIGILYSNSRDYAAAIESFTNAVEAGYSQSQWAIYNRGLAHHNLGEFEEALADYRAAVQIQPFPAAYNALKQLLLELGRPEEVVEVLNETIKAFPTQSEYYIERYRLLSSLGRFDEAIEAMTETIELFPYMAETYFERGGIYLAHVGDQQKALEDFQQAAEIDPYNPDYLMRIGDIYMDMGDEDAAIAAYEQYIAVVGEANAFPEILRLVKGVSALQPPTQENTQEPAAESTVEATAFPQTQVAALPVENQHYNTTGQVLYRQQNSVSGQSALFLTTGEGSPTQVTAETSIQRGAWLPDGQRIVFADAEGLYLIAPDGTHLIQLASAPAVTKIAAASDGRRIAYAAANHVWIVNVDGSENTNITANNGDYVSYGERLLEWSPDSERLLISGTHDTAAAPFDILEVRADGSSFNIAVPTFDPNIVMSGPVFSPDGRHMAFTPEGAATPGLWVIEVENGLITRFDAPETARFPVWSPDGTHIAFISDNGIYIAEMGSSAPPERIAARVLERQSNAVWTPDGQGIVFRACSRGGSVICELFSVRLDDSELRQLTDNNEAKVYPLMSPLVE